jgi:regulation of enolase protein 1 (concanavalin A-like superfamily)
MPWINEPAQWSREGDTLVVVTDANTDFWRETFYGFVHDNGHILGEPVSGDFTAEVSVSATYTELYDQAGLMLRSSPTEWIKAGVEFAHGRATLGSVLTLGRSDWGIGPEIAPTDSVDLRLTRKGPAVCVQWRSPGDATWRTLRLGHYGGEKALVGPMTCSPTRSGLVTRFTGFRVGPAVDFAGEV